MAKQYLGTKLQDLGDVLNLDVSDKIVIVKPKDEGVMRLDAFIFYIQQNLDLSNYYTAAEADAKFARRAEVYTSTQADAKFAFIDRVYTKVQSDSKYALKEDTYDRAAMDDRYANRAQSYTKNELYSKEETFQIFALKADIPAPVDLTPYSTTAQGDRRWAIKTEVYSKMDSDTRFAPIYSAYDKVDADNRFAKLALTYTKEETDARFLDISEAYDKTHIQLNYYVKSELYTKLESDTRFALKSNVYTISAVNEQFAAKSWVYSRGEAEATFAPILTTYTKMEVASAINAAVNPVATDLAKNYYPKTDSDAKFALLSATYTRTQTDAKYALLTDTLTTTQLAAQYFNKTQINAMFGAIDYTPFLLKTDAAATYATLLGTLSKTHIETYYYTKAQVDDAIRAAEQGVASDSEARYITAGFADERYAKRVDTYTKAEVFTKAEVNGSIIALDTRNTNQTPAWYQANYNLRAAREFKHLHLIDLPGMATYGGLTTNVFYSDSSGGYAVQHVHTDQNRFFIRSGSSDTTWTPWLEMETVTSAAAKYYTKAESDNRHYLKAESDGLFTTKAELNTAMGTVYTKATADTRFAASGSSYLKAQADARFIPYTLDKLDITVDKATGLPALSFKNTNATNLEAGEVAWHNKDYRLGGLRVSNTAANQARFVVDLRPNFTTAAITALTVTPESMTHAAYGRLDSYFAKRSESYTQSVIDDLLNDIRAAYVKTIDANATYQTIAGHNTLSNKVSSLEQTVSNNATTATATFAPKTSVYTKVDADARYLPNTGVARITGNAAWTVDVALKIRNTNATTDHRGGIGWENATGRDIGYLYYRDYLTNGSEAIFTTHVPAYSERNEVETFRIHSTGLWHYTYGYLHDYFAKAAETYTRAVSDARFAFKTDVFTKTESNANFAPKAQTYTKQEADTLFATNANLGNNAGALAPLTTRHAARTIKTVNRQLAAGEHIIAFCGSRSAAKFMLSGSVGGTHFNLEFEASVTHDLPAIQLNNYTVWDDHGQITRINAIWAGENDGILLTLTLGSGRLQNDGIYLNQIQMLDNYGINQFTLLDTPVIIGTDVDSKATEKAAMLANGIGELPYDSLRGASAKVVSLRLRKYLTRATTGDLHTNTQLGVGSENNAWSKLTPTALTMQQGSTVLGSVGIASGGTLLEFSGIANNLSARFAWMSSEGMWHAKYGALHDYFAQASNTYSKAQVDNSFNVLASTLYSKTESDNRYYTKADTQATFTTKTEVFNKTDADARFIKLSEMNDNKAALTALTSPRGETKVYPSTIEFKAGWHTVAFGYGMLHARFKLYVLGGNYHTLDFSISRTWNDTPSITVHEHSGSDKNFNISEIKVVYGSSYDGTLIRLKFETTCWGYYFSKTDNIAYESVEFCNPIVATGTDTASKAIEEAAIGGVIKLANMNYETSLVIGGRAGFAVSRPLLAKAGLSTGDVTGFSVLDKTGLSWGTSATESKLGVVTTGGNSTLQYTGQQGGVLKSLLTVSPTAITHLTYGDLHTYFAKAGESYTRAELYTKAQSDDRFLSKNGLAQVSANSTIETDLGFKIKQLGDNSLRGGIYWANITGEIDASLTTVTGNSGATTYLNQRRLGDALWVSSLVIDSSRMTHAAYGHLHEYFAKASETYTKAQADTRFIYRSEIGNNTRYLKDVTSRRGTTLVSNPTNVAAGWVVIAAGSWENSASFVVGNDIINTRTEQYLEFTAGFFDKPVITVTNNGFTERNKITGIRVSYADYKGGGFVIQVQISEPLNIVTKMSNNVNAYAMILLDEPMPITSEKLKPLLPHTLTDLRFNFDVALTPNLNYKTQGIIEADLGFKSGSNTSQTSMDRYGFTWRVDNKTASAIQSSSTALSFHLKDSMDLLTKYAEVRTTGIWHSSYGLLHDYFAKKSEVYTKTEADARYLPTNGLPVISKAETTNESGLGLIIQQKADSYINGGIFWRNKDFNETASMSTVVFGGTANTYINHMKNGVMQTTLQLTPDWIRHSAYGNLHEYFAKTVDVYSKSASDARFALKTDSYVKADADVRFASKSDTYTKAETASLFLPVIKTPGDLMILAPNLTQQGRIKIVSNLSYDNDWWTIACGSGNGIADFYLSDFTGNIQEVFHFSIAISYGTNPSITVHNCSGYYGQSLTAIQLAYGSTYDGYLVRLKFEAGGSLNSIKMANNVGLECKLFDTPVRKSEEGNNSTITTMCNLPNILAANLTETLNLKFLRGGMQLSRALNTQHSVGIGIKGDRDTVLTGSGISYYVGGQERFKVTVLNDYWGFYHGAADALALTFNLDNIWHKTYGYLHDYFAKASESYTRTEIDAKVTALSNNVYTKTISDERFAVKNSAYLKAESDTRFAYRSDFAGKPEALAPFTLRHNNVQRIDAGNTMHNVGWYTIAAGGFQCQGDITVTDMHDSGLLIMSFRVSCSFGAYPNIVVKQASAFGGIRQIQKIRICHGGAYDGMRVQIYGTLATCNIRITNNDGYDNLQLLPVPVPNGVDEASKAIELAAVRDYLSRYGNGEAATEAYNNQTLTHEVEPNKYGAPTSSRYYQAKAGFVAGDDTESTKLDHTGLRWFKGAFDTTPYIEVVPYSNGAFTGFDIRANGETLLAFDYTGIKHSKYGFFHNYFALAADSYTRTHIDTWFNDRYTKAEVYTKSEVNTLANDRYTKAQSDERYAYRSQSYLKTEVYTKAESDGRYYTKSESYTKDEIATLLKAPDTRDTNEEPLWYRLNYNRQQAREFKTLNSIGLAGYGGIYAGLITNNFYGDFSGGLPVQMVHTNANRLLLRTAVSDGLWSNWLEMESVTGAANKYYTKSEVYTKLEVDNKVNALALNTYSKEEANARYAYRSDIYYRTEIDSAFSSVRADLANVYNKAHVDLWMHDRYTKAESDARFAYRSEVYSINYIDTNLSNIRTSITNLTNDVYNKSAVYTKTESDSRYHFKTAFGLNITGTGGPQLALFNSNTVGEDGPYIDFYKGTRGLAKIESNTTGLEFTTGDGSGGIIKTFAIGYNWLWARGYGYLHNYFLARNYAPEVSLITPGKRVMMMEVTNWVVKNIPARAFEVDFGKIMNVAATDVVGIQGGITSTTASTWYHRNIDEWFIARGSTVIVMYSPGISATDFANATPNRIILTYLAPTV